jgi:predicted nucleotidyltransferase
MEHASSSFEDLVRRGCTSIREHLPHIFGIYLFGSAVDGSLTDDSDIDLAIIGDRVCERFAILEEQSRLEALFNRPVDLIDLRNADPVLRAEAMLKGRLVFSSDQVRTVLAELETSRLLEEHKAWIEPIVRDILARDSTFRQSGQ